MDFWKDFLLEVVFLACLLSTGLMFYDEDLTANGGVARCPWIKNRLRNGRVKIRSRGRIAKFICRPGYELVGSRFATCVRSQWNNPLPICVSTGCINMDAPRNGEVITMNNGAILVYNCNPGYELKGSATIYCDGAYWNDSAPICAVPSGEPSTSCDFEVPDLCGWTHDPNHDFDWQRHQFRTPSGHVDTGPSYDHTFGKGKGGFYMYIEASSPRKENDTARLYSPIYPPLQSWGCFVFWYHMYGHTIGSLRVYIKPESQLFAELLPVWEKAQDQGNQWLRGAVSVPSLPENFQVIIEGIRGTSYVGDAAIDDVSLQSVDCLSAESFNTSLSSEETPESCRGRCGEAVTNSPCGCTSECAQNNSCCADYWKMCLKSSDNSSTEVEFPEDIIPGIPVTPRVQDSSVSESTTIPSVTEASSSTTGNPSVVPTVVRSPKTLGTSSIRIGYQSTVSVAGSRTTGTQSVKSSRTPITSTIPTSETTAVTTKKIPILKSTVLVLKTTSRLPVKSTTLRTTKTSTLPKTTTLKATTLKTTTTPSTTMTTSTTVKATTVKATTTPPLQTTTMKSTTTMTPPTTVAKVTTTATTQAATTPRKTTATDRFTTAAYKTTLVAVTTRPSPTTVAPTTTISSTQTLSSPPLTTTTVSTEDWTTSAATTVASFSSTQRSSTPSISPETSLITTLNPVQKISTRYFTSSTEPWHANSIPEAHVVDVTTQFRKRTTRNTVTTNNPELKTSSGTMRSSITPFGSKKVSMTVFFTSDVTPSRRKSTRKPSSSASKAVKENSSFTTIVAGVTCGIIAALCLLGVIVYFIAKKRKTVQSKLSEDSEMKYLSDNEVIEFSDPSALNT